MGGGSRRPPGERRRRRRRGWRGGHVVSEPSLSPFPPEQSLFAPTLIAMHFSDPYTVQYL